MEKIFKYSIESPQKGDFLVQKFAFLQKLIILLSKNLKN